MMSLMFRALSVLTVVMFLTAAADAAGIANAPDVHVGDSWTYSKKDGFDGTVIVEYTHKIVQLEGAEITVRLSNAGAKNTQVIYFTREWNTLDLGNTQFIPNFPRFDFPLSIGKNWSKDFKVKNANGTYASGHLHAKIEAEEDVTVPAGTFHCFKIVYANDTVASDSQSTSSKTNIIIWYSAEVNNIVKSETTRTAEGRIRSKEFYELTSHSVASPTAVKP